MLKSGKIVGKESYWKLTSHGLVVAVINSPDGRFLASGANHTVLIWKANFL